MSIMDLKVLREIKTHKFRSFLIIISVALTLGMVIGMRGAYPMIMASYEEDLLQNNVADGRFTFTSVPIQESNITDIKNNYRESFELDTIEGRIQIKTELTYNDEKFPAIVIGIEYPNKINQLTIEKKADNIDDDSDFLEDTTNCIVESKFAGELLGQDVQVDDDFQIELGNEILDSTVKAIGSDTDFLYVVDPDSQMTLMGQMAVVWIDLDTMQDALYQGAPLINQILFTMEDRLDKDKTIDASEDFIGYFKTHNIPVSSLQFTSFDETIDRNFFKADAGAIDEFGTIFGIIGLIICSVVIYGMLSRIVQSQRRNIGLFMSMGAKKKKIIFHYLKITILLSSIGAIIGMFLGYGFSIGLVRLVGELYPLQNYVFPIAVGEYFFGTLITLAVASAFSVLSILPILNVTPRDAMTAFFNRIKVTKETISEKIFGWLPMFRSIHMRVSLREVFLRKKKSIVSILAVSTSMIILIISLGMVVNMVGSLNDYYDKYNTADVEIQLDGFYSVSEIDSFMDNQSDEDIPHYESYISLFTKFDTGDNESYLELLCYQENSSFRNFNIISGDVDSKKDITEDKIILGQSIAGKYDINVNDEITIGTLNDKNVKVAGLLGELIDTSAFWTIEAFQKNNVSNEYFGIPKGFVNGILLNFSDSISNKERQAIQDEFKSHFNVAQWTDTEDAKRSILGLMESMMGVLVIFLAVGILIGVIFTFNTMYMGLLSRMNDFLAFKAMGTDPKYIRKMIFWEHVLLSVFSLIITIPIGYIFYAWSMDYLMGEQFYFPISIPWYTWPLVFLLSLFSIWLATRRIMKKIEKLVLADELRQRIIS